VADLGALHSTRVWLPPTMTWLSTQVAHLPPSVRSEVACDEVRDAGRWAKVPLHRVGHRDPWRPWRKPDHHLRARQVARVARRRGMRLLHSHYGNYGWQDMPAATSERMAHAVSFYGQDLTRFPVADPRWNDRYRDLLGSGATILCEGPHMASVAQRFNAQGRVRVHHLGVDVAAIPFRPRSYAGGRPLRVLLAGTFREKKGFPDALAALEQAARRGLKVEATLVGEGDAASRDETAKVEAAAAQAAEVVSLTRLGYQTHARLAELAYQHDVFLSPSRTAADGDTEGGAPVSVIEMAASGMPVVATTHCDIPHVLPPSNAPYLAAEGDVDGLADRLLLLAQRPWDRLLADARRRIEAEFDAVRQGQRLGELYHGLVAA
jgi:colanic acid/amylovoran biosynthesis glycosyltransferase